MLRFFLLAFLSPFIFFAQNNTQVLRGLVRDQMSQAPIAAVTIELVSTTYKTLTDSLGTFQFLDLKPGRYALLVSKDGYKAVRMANVIVTSGKEVILEIDLAEQIQNIEDISLQQPKQAASESLSRVSTRTFTMEEVNRYAGGRNDPARLAANFAGVSAPDDSRNDVVIRGNSPVGVLWRIDGMNVSNPNHFATVGTTGGSVSALNTNLLKKADFYTSAFPATFGNANAGVFDLTFRDGNSKKRETTLQAGVITGLELTTEGPFSKKSQASYLLGYRYSLAGIAQAMGVNIGTTATPTYQDLSFKLNSGTTPFGKFTVFGILANSTIQIGGGNVNTLYGNGNKVDFASKIGIIGLSHLKQLTPKAFFQTTFGINYSQNNQTSYDVDHFTDSSFVKESSLATKNTTFLSTSYNWKINKRFFFKLGVQDEIIGLDLYYRTRNQLFEPEKTIWDYNSATHLMQFFAHLTYRLTDQLTFQTGVHSQYLWLNGSNSIEPRFGCSYTLDAKSTFNLGYGLHSQMQPINVYFLQIVDINGVTSLPNQQLDFTKSHHFVLSYQYQPKQDWRFKTELYYQSLFNVPINTYESSYSMLNTGSSFKTDLTDSLINLGTGKNYGFELTVEKSFSQGYYGLLTGSIYESNYIGSDGIERNTSFNGKYVMNFLCGKEWKLGANNGNSLTLDLKFTNAGGRAYTPIDLASSIAQDREILSTAVNSEFYQTYYRLDLKAGLTINSPRRKIAHTLALDLQNLSNHKNIFSESYDRQKQSIRYTYQLGFFPNVVYKLQF